MYSNPSCLRAFASDSFILMATNLVPFRKIFRNVCFIHCLNTKGINWLAFLRKFNLHGILCDDMGLGKTLQSICILAGDHYEKEKNVKENMKKSCSKSSKLECQSLVICPPTLTGHWYYEILKFISKDFLHPLHYTGPPLERKRLQNCFDNHNLIIASYKIVRNEIGYFSKRKWNYIILDEGHTIKNGKTKSSKAIKELVCNHRLILTGTPIQNNVLELWSLFDFLMPGFLGTEKQFMSNHTVGIYKKVSLFSESSVVGKVMGLY
ncbi:TATA-binding protein-associated factor [Armadillidium vulgare]|nr:TATA-binding protein-associated factor [Armadillidium vulgare]